MDLGKRFRHFRKMKGLTQKDAAKLIGVKYYQLGNYETNRSEPSIDVLKRMSKIYEVTIDGLVGNIFHKSKLVSPNYSEIDDLLNQLNDVVSQLNKNRDK